MENIYEKFVFLRRENKNPLLIDCGSNIGSSSEYFSRIFKNLFCILIEPNKVSANFSRYNLYNKNYLFNK